MFIDYKQKIWPNLLTMAKFTYNNIMTKMTSFKMNYKQNLRMGFELRKKERSVRTEKFVK